MSGVMDKKRGAVNVSVSIAFKIAILIADILVRRYLIRYIGNEVNGLNSLYLSILKFLAVAELGVGSAITFCMYKPIVEGNSDKVAALYHLFTKLYLVIGCIIAVGGCAVMPALPYLAKDYQSADVNLYLTFGLVLISVVMTYMFSSKTSLVNAYKNNYISTTIHSCGQLLQCGVQIIVLITTRSFVWYLVCRIGSVALQWGVTEIVARVKHGGIIRNRQKAEPQEKKEVTKNVKAMFMHKIGAVLVNTADSIIISAFIGISMLGKYTNYTTIMVAMTGVITLCFTPLTSVIGHMCVGDDKRAAQKYHSFFHTFNFVLGTVFFLGYYSVIDNLVVIFYGKADLELARAISFVITLNYFVQFMRQSTLLFRDATGTFYNDRWKPLIEGAINVGLSIHFVNVFPSEYNVVGVIVATIITNIFICHIVEPHVLFKYAFKSGAKEYYIRNYIYIGAFAAVLVALHFCHVDFTSRWTELVANGFIAVALAVVPCVTAALVNKNFRHFGASVLRKIKSKFVHKNADAPVAVGNENGEQISQCENSDAQKSDASDNEKRNGGSGTAADAAERGSAGDDGDGGCE